MIKNKKARVLVGVTVFLIFVTLDFWRGYHQSRSIPLGVITAIGGILDGLLVFFWMWPGPADDRPDGQDSSGTLI
ncbi:MAG TPA: hypothetical protein VN176_04550 [Verrucomicrobiae bacterium]|jgi:hypothetical protein|nr:hypothetical protein [Verrucomicrobiae bacterium]